MLIKIDHRVSYMLGESRDGVVSEMERSGKMYSWVKGEDIGDVVERFAIANPRATFGQMLDWSKRTYMTRLKAFKEKSTLPNNIFKSDAFDPTSPSAQTQSIPADPQPSQGVTEIRDNITARPKVRTDLKKVAEAGNEPDEVDENPGLPSADILAQPPTQRDDGVDSQGNVAEKPTDALAKFKTV